MSRAIPQCCLAQWCDGATFAQSHAHPGSFGERAQSRPARVGSCFAGGASVILGTHREGSVFLL